MTDDQSGQWAGGGWHFGVSEREVPQNNNYNHFNTTFTSNLEAGTLFGLGIVRPLTKASARRVSLLRIVPGVSKPLVTTSFPFFPTGESNGELGPVYRAVGAEVSFLCLLSRVDQSSYLLLLQDFSQPVHRRLRVM